MTYDLKSWRFWSAIIFMVLAAALPVAFYLRTYDSVTAKYTIMQIGVLAALACWTAGSLLEERFEIPSAAFPFLLPAAGLFFWNAARFLIAPYKIAAFPGFLTQELFLLSFMLALVALSGSYLRALVLAAAGGLAVTVLYGLAQYFGLDPFVWKGAFGDNVFSTVGNPVYLAAYLAVASPFALMIVADRSFPAPMRGAAVLLSVLAGAVVALTGERVELVIYLAVIAGFAGLIAARERAAGLRQVLATVAASAAACLLALAFLAPKPSSFASGGAQMALIRSSSLEVARNAGPAGFGPGSFWVRYPPFRSQEQLLLHHKHNIQTDHAGNELLEQWAEGGAIGALLWLALFAVTLYKAFTGGFSPESSGYGCGLTVSVLGGLAVSMLSLNVPRSLPAGWLLYFNAGLLAMISASGQKAERKILAIPAPLGAFRFLPAGAVAALFCLGAYFSGRLFNADMQHNLGLYYSKQGQWGLAESAYEKEFPGSGSYVAAQYFIGNGYMDWGRTGDLERAVEQYRKVRLLAPDYVQVHYREGLALKKLGRCSEAVERMERQVRLDPVWPEAWNELSDIYKAVGEAQKAAEAAEKAKAAAELWDNYRGS
ncbi:MAG: hypothetical protein PHV33_08610 [Elusimicrobiales bacterium]|nr:hypothetical protein [Elusimicrobiales bacterium]